MGIEGVKREILAGSKAFKHYWKTNGPFKYALTSSEFPPVLLAPEEWIFSNDVEMLLKSLIQFEKRKMKIINAPFNPENKHILRPETLSPWKLCNFPEEWDACVCDSFVPQGHLTQAVFEKNEISEDKATPRQAEAFFFQCLATEIEQIGYLLFKPRGSSKYADMGKYLAEWEQDEMDAGFL